MLPVGFHPPWSSPLWSCLLLQQTGAEADNILLACQIESHRACISSHLYESPLPCLSKGAGRSQSNHSSPPSEGTTVCLPEWGQGLHFISLGLLISCFTEQPKKRSFKTSLYLDHLKCHFLIWGNPAVFTDVVLGLFQGSNWIEPNDLLTRSNAPAEHFKQVTHEHLNEYFLCFLTFS